jgi:hypothetical protein
MVSTSSFCLFSAVLGMGGVLGSAGTAVDVGVWVNHERMVSVETSLRSILTQSESTNAVVNDKVHEIINVGAKVQRGMAAWTAQSDDDDDATSSAFVTISTYADNKCTEHYKSVVYQTDLCVMIDSATDGAVATMYVWDASIHGLYTNLYSDTSCSTTVNTELMISFGTPTAENTCLGNAEYALSDTFSISSEDGFVIEYYTSTTTCDAGTSPAIGVWVTTAVDDYVYLYDDDYAGGKCPDVDEDVLNVSSDIK